MPNDFYNLIDTKFDSEYFSIYLTNYKNLQWLAEHAILAAKNVDVNNINIKIKNVMPGEIFKFKSIDTVMNQDESVNYPIEFLNSLDLEGLPTPILYLKIGTPLILLQNKYKIRENNNE